MKNIIFLPVIICIILSTLVMAREKPEGTPPPTPVKEPKNYTYFIKRGGLFRYEEGNREEEEAYLTIGMTKADIIKLDDIKTFDLLTFEFQGDIIEKIWVKSERIRTSGGLGLGSPTEKLEKYQTISVDENTRAYTPPYSGIIFYSIDNRDTVDMILICTSSISEDIYNTVYGGNEFSTYIEYGNGKPIEGMMNEVIAELYSTLNMSPCFLKDIIPVSTREELGEIWALYGGINRPVTSFCVNHEMGSVIYVINQSSPDHHFRGILAHEYAHLWHYRLIGHQEKNQFISEGFAEWVRYHYEKEYFQDCIEYRDGLNFFLELEEKKGLKGVFEYLLKNA